MSFFYNYLCAPLCLHRTVNELRSEVNRLQSENDRLHSENDRLEASTKKLQEVESQLEEISVLQGKSVDTLVEQVKEFKKIQADIKETLQAKVLQNLITAIVSSDSDKDFIIDPEEVDNLTLRLKNIEGVDFSEDNFNKAMAKSGYDPAKAKEGGYGVGAVIEVMKNLVDDDVAEEDNIFTLKTDVLAESSTKP